MRLHMVDDGPPLEGVFDGFVCGHYRLLNARIVRAPDRTEALEDEAWVPRSRVVFAQTLKS